MKGGIKKWKIKTVPKRSLWSKLNGPHKFTKFNSIEKGTILTMILVSGFLLFAYMDYQYTSGLPGTAGYQKPDPFTTIWNGQIPTTYNSITPGTPVFFQNLLGSTAGVSFVNITQGDFIGAKVNTIFLSTWTGWCSISDDAGNTWHILNPTTGTDIVAYSIVSNPFTNDRVLFHPCGSGSATGASMVQIYHTPGKVGSVVFSSTSPLSISTSANSLVWTSFQGIHPTTFTSGETLRGTVDGGVGNCESINGDQLFANAGVQSLSASGGICSAITPFAAVELQAVPAGSTTPCTNSGYQCFNAKIFNGNINLNFNQTTIADALTNSSIDLSTGVNKALSFAILDTNACLSSNCRGLEWGWYLTINGTIPSNPTYSPTNDTNVALAEIVTITANHINYYLYMNRNIGRNTLFQGTENPSPCTQQFSLYMCASNTTNSGSIFTPMVLNYSAGATGVNNALGLSYFCTEAGSGGSTCNFGGANNAQVPLANTIIHSNYTEPWLNVQNKYYVGYWAARNLPLLSLIFTTGQNGVENNVISLYTPSANGNTIESSFQGWLGSALGGAWNAVGSFLGPILTPALNLGNSLMGAFISAMVQVFTILANDFRSTLNFIGQHLGIGNVGDVIFTVFQQIGSQVIAVVSAIFNFFAFVYSFFTSGYNSFIVNGIVVFTNVIINAMLVLWGIVFTINYSLSTIFFLDFAYCTWRVYNDGVDGLFDWIGFNRFVFQFVFDLLWVVVDHGTRGFLRIKNVIAQWV